MVEGVASGSRVNKYIQTTWWNNLLGKKNPFGRVSFVVAFEYSGKKGKMKSKEGGINIKKKRKKKEKGQEKNEKTSSTYSDTLCLIYIGCIIPCF